MQTTYRLKAKEITMGFLKTLKSRFAGQEVEIIVKSIAPETLNSSKNSQLLDMIVENRQRAPLISNGVDIRKLIDESQYPAQ